jgi:transcriptional regulator with AAA-type ATPase domain
VAEHYDLLGIGSGPGGQRTAIQLRRAGPRCMAPRFFRPGNIRELPNVVERSGIVRETKTFSVDESCLSLDTLPIQPKNHALLKRPVTQEAEIPLATIPDHYSRTSRDSCTSRA